MGAHVSNIQVSPSSKYHPTFAMFMSPYRFFHIASKQADKNQQRNSSLFKAPQKKKVMNGVSTRSTPPQKRGNKNHPRTLKEQKSSKNNFQACKLEPCKEKKNSKKPNGEAGTWKRGPPGSLEIHMENPSFLGVSTLVFGGVTPSIKCRNWIEAFLGDWCFWHTWFHPAFVLFVNLLDASVSVHQFFSQNTS